MHVQVARRKRYTSPDFMGNLQARLFAIRRAQVGVKVIGEANRRNRQSRWHSSGKEIIRGGNCSGASDGRLNKSGLDRGDAWEQLLRVGLVARAQPLRGVKDLANARNQTVIEDPESSSNHAVCAVSIGDAQTRLEVVHVIF